MEKYHKHAKSQAAAVKVDSPSFTKVGERSPSGDEPGGGASLPCLYSNNSIENKEQTALQGLVSLLSPYWKKSAQTLYLNVERLCEEAESLGHIGFLTITFKDNITDSREASRRLNSLNSNFFNKDPRFSTKIITKEPQKRGAWHYHILISLSQDIKEGFNFEGVKNRDYSSANPFLRQLWKDIRSACEKYGFGRSELMPIKSNSEAMGRYIGKYISKGMDNRTKDQRGVRLVTYSKGWTRNSPKFAWNTPNASLWRMKLKYFAKIHGCTELYQLSEKLGPGWCWTYLHDIIGVFDALIDYMEEWHFEGGKGLAYGISEEKRVSKKTGEVQTPNQYMHEDKLFEAIQNNQKAKEQRLKAEVTGKLEWNCTQRQVFQNLRKKEKKNHKVEAVKQLIRETELEPGIPSSQEEKEKRYSDYLIREAEREEEKRLFREYLETVKFYKKPTNEEKKCLETLPNAPF